MSKQSLSEKALDYIQKFHNREPNYFQSKPNQRKARQGFIDLYNLEQKKGEDIWNHTFPKFLRKNRLKKEDFLKTRFRKSKVSDINAIIKPEPQNFALEKNSVEIINEEPHLMLVYASVEIKDIDKMRKEKGIEPESFIDVLALSGDSSDNIPGVPGIGLKTALDLIREWKSLENVLTNVDKIKGKKRQENLFKYAELARISKRLATIDTQVPLDFNLDTCRLTNFNNNRLNELFTTYGFNSFLADNHDKN